MNWKNGKRWAYSITYDEGCAALLDHALEAHRHHDIPGHVALVSSQIGVPRDVPGSSYDGMMILAKDQIHMLAEEWWGVSCYSMTHAGVTAENAEYEVVEARTVLEEAIDMEVRMFCVPCNNEGYLPALAMAGAVGYHSILTCYDDVNTLDTDPLRLARCPLHTRYPPPFFST